MLEVLPPHTCVRRVRSALGALPEAERDQIQFLFLLVYPELSSKLALAENPVEHHLCVLENMMRIGASESVDPIRQGQNPPSQRIVLKRAAALSLLHDIAPVGKISKRQIDELEQQAQQETDAAKKRELEQKAAMLKLRQQESRTLHMRMGAALAQERLLQLNQLFGEVVFSQQDIEEICEVIRIHDNPTLRKPISRDNWIALCFREADRLWMVTREGILADLNRERKEVTEEAIKIRARQNRDRHREEQRDCYPNDPTCMNGTFYRTKTGYAIYEEWCRKWGLEP